MDIVERLRAYRDDTDLDLNDIAEAADEIERLQRLVLTFKEGFDALYSGVIVQNANTAAAAGEGGGI